MTQDAEQASDEPEELPSPEEEHEEPLDDEEREAILKQLRSLGYLG